MDWNEMATWSRAWRIFFSSHVKLFWVSTMLFFWRLILSWHLYHQPLFPLLFFWRAVLARQCFHRGDEITARPLLPYNFNELDAKIRNDAFLFPRYIFNGYNILNMRFQLWRTVIQWFNLYDSLGVRMWWWCGNENNLPHESSTRMSFMPLFSLSVHSLFPRAMPWGFCMVNGKDASSSTRLSPFHLPY